MIPFIVVVVILSSILFLHRRFKNERYSLDHAILNISPPKTLWMNMGYWKKTKSFPEACGALFRLLLQNADVNVGQDILDIGCGCGDSTSFLAGFQPRSLRGITSQPSQCLIAAKRFPQIEFVCADAVEFVSRLPEKSVDRIIAVDCVYHFDTRVTFLRQACKVLRWGGKIALTDLVLGENLSVSQSLLMRFICLLTGSPFGNFMTARGYVESFGHVGFEGVEIEDISEYVFPGLSEFILSHKREMGSYGVSGKWSGYVVFARILNWWWASTVVRFIVVHARRSDM